MYYKKMLNIRNAKLEDIKTIHTLGEHVNEFNTSNATVTFWPESILLASVKTNTVIILVAEEDDQNIAGFIIINCNKPLSKALIENIYVRPNRRKQNVGTELVRAAILAAKKRSYEFISVLTSPGNTAAIKTYEKAGFIQGEAFLWLDYSDYEDVRKLQ